MTLSEIVAANKRGFANVMRFEGRDRPRQFWPYGLFLYALSALAGLALTVPMMISAFKSAFAAVGASAGANVDPQQMQAEMMRDIMAQTQAILPLSLAINAVFMALIAAAVVRRLHDRDWSGWWVLILPGTAAIGAVTSLWMFDAMASDPAMLIEQPQLFQLAGWLPLIGYIVLIVQMVQGGDPRANRFGDPPA